MLRLSSSAVFGAANLFAGDCILDVPVVLFVLQAHARENLVVSQLSPAVQDVGELAVVQADLVCEFPQRLVSLFLFEDPHNVPHGEAFALHARALLDFSGASSFLGGIRLVTPSRISSSRSLRLCFPVSSSFFRNSGVMSTSPILAPFRAVLIVCILIIHVSIFVNKLMTAARFSR